MSLVSPFVRRALLGAACLFLLPATLPAVPALLNHQGRVAVNGVNFEGSGRFKFALVNGTGSITYWSNDGTSTAGSEPAAAVTLPVSRGLYALLLGDTALANMSAVPVAVFDNPDVRLRVWFNDGVKGFQKITPDQRLAAAPYALLAARAETVDRISMDNLLAAPAKPVVGWGENHDGQTTVPPLTGVISLAGGSTSSLALLENGTVAAWGLAASVPTGLTGVKQIASGPLHFLARKTDGTVVAWGDNTYGNATVPPGIDNAISIAAGEKHSLVLRIDGTVTAWGDNSFNQTTVPPTATGVRAIAAGYDHNLALKADGTVIAWGRNDAGQTTVPAGLTGVTAIGAGAYHSLAVKSDGTVVAWGWNLGGQATVPGGLTGVVKAVGGYAFSAALKTDGTVVAWGDNSSGQITVPAGTTSGTLIAAGAAHALVLRSGLVPAKVARLDQENLFTERLGIRRAPATNALEVEGQASKSTAGNWLANSDGRIKTDVRPIDGALDKLDRVRLVEFLYTKDYLAAHPDIENRRYLNVIAQEFAAIFPEHVKSSGETLPDGSPVLQVDTYPLTIYSAAAVQELHRENEALKARLAAQEERLRKLEAALLPK